MSEKINWIRPTAAELHGKHIKITTPKDQPIWSALVTDENGNGIGNIKRVVIIMDIDANGNQSAKARIGLWQPEPGMFEGHIEEIDIANPELDINATADTSEEEQA